MTIKFLSISIFDRDFFSWFWIFTKIFVYYLQEEAKKIGNNDDDNSSRGKEAFDGDQNILRQDRDDKVIGCRWGQVNTNQKRDKLRIPRPKKVGFTKTPIYYWNSYIITWAF